MHVKSQSIFNLLHNGYATWTRTHGIETARKPLEALPSIKYRTNKRVPILWQSLTEEMSWIRNDVLNSTGKPSHTRVVEMRTQWRKECFFESNVCAYNKLNDCRENRSHGIIQDKIPGRSWELNWAKLHWIRGWYCLNGGKREKLTLLTCFKKWSKKSKCFCYYYKASEQNESGSSNIINLYIKYR